MPCLWTRVDSPHLSALFLSFLTLIRLSADRPRPTGPEHLDVGSKIPSWANNQLSQVDPSLCLMRCRQLNRIV
ncbi:hypothetical protein B0H10DRAFT_2040718 [Mycena sp. CBHHK59/15]|nr:hypothetical protein B0H10DRAFT_2040718 [Mycena sp. CBHHK59/15]